MTRLAERVITWGRVVGDQSERGVEKGKRGEPIGSTRLGEKKRAHIALDLETRLERVILGASSSETTGRFYEDERRELNTSHHINDQVLRAESFFFGK